jgi:hypothetical protein
MDTGKRNIEPRPLNKKALLAGHKHLKYSQITYLLTKTRKARQK